MTPSDSTATQPAFEDENRSAVSERLRIILVSVFCASLIAAPVGLWAANGQMLWTAVVGGLTAAVAFGLNRIGRVDGAVFFLLVAMLMAVTANLVVGEGIHDSGMILYPTIVVVGGLLLRPRTFAIVVVLLVIVLGVSLGVVPFVVTLLLAPLALVLLAGELCAIGIYAAGGNRLVSATLQAIFLAWTIASTMPLVG